MTEDLTYFTDILEPRKQKTGICSFMTRNWKPRKTMKLDKNYSPQDIKEIVSKSVYLDAILEAECAKTGVSKEKLHQQVLQFLEEMGCDKKMHVIRWMGIIFLKISFMMKIRMLVSHDHVLKVKSLMGSHPVLFLPTHRSYADFCLMTYLCYHYDIELPAVAAGMDFHSMAVMGRRMRETGAFYIRRTLAGSPLYASTLREYVWTLVAKYGAPIEFFVEGTRSRSNKSLQPKYGMLAMSLMPFFAREVSDITIIPISINYDRLMEQKLFAYEHIGVPKPKESTGGFLKSLKSLNDDFGDIYINLASPISVRKFMKHNVTDNHPQDHQEHLKPAALQEMSPKEFENVQDIAHEVVTLQQRNTAITMTNLIALSLMQTFMVNYPMPFEDICAETQFMMEMLLSRGAEVCTKDNTMTMEKVLVVHQKLMALDKEKKLRILLEPVMQVSSEMKAKMKGIEFDAPTLSYMLPIIQLQLYVNPTVHWFLPAAIVYLVASKGPMSDYELGIRYLVIRKLLRYEIYYSEKSSRLSFAQEVEYCLQHRLIVRGKNGFTTEGGNGKVQLLFRWIAYPALTTLKICAEIMSEVKECTHAQALKLIQQRMLERNYHPYSLSIEAAANCLQGLVAFGALLKPQANEVKYEVVPELLRKCCAILSQALPTFHYSRSNSVLMAEKAVARL